MPRSSSQMDEPKDKERVIYVSWFPDDFGLAAACLDKLKEAFEANNIDDMGRSITLYDNDVTKLAGKEVGADRQHLSITTDFIALISDKYIVTSRRACNDGKPDLISFLERRNDPERASGLTMWIFPVEAVRLANIAFKSVGLNHIAFPWWHGRSDDNDQIPMPGADLAVKQQFICDIKRRVALMLEHPQGCKPCGDETHMEGTT